MRLLFLYDTYAICRLEPETKIPEWATGTFSAIVRTANELSIICRQTQVPDDVSAERDLRCIKVEDILEPDATGVISSLTTPLADKGVSVFVVSTHDTDYLFVKETDLETAFITWAFENGHDIAEQFRPTN